ncbi:MAG: amino acid synthesis family protein [Pseudomonadota bacterium]
MEIRKLVVQFEETHRELDRALVWPARKALAMAVIVNPFAGRFVEDLTPLIEMGAALGHKAAAYVRSHFDAVEACIPDAPGANEILVALAVTDSARPLPRIGGLEAADAKGEDGLR